MEETRRPSIRVTTYRQHSADSSSSSLSERNKFPREPAGIDDGKPVVVHDLVGNSVTTLTGASRSGSAVVVSNKQSGTETRDSNEGSLSRRASSGKESATFSETQQVVHHRTGWDLYGMVEDKEDSPTRKFAGLKLKYRYPVPPDVRDGHTYSGYVVVRQWSTAGVRQKWKTRWMIIKENKAFLLKSETDKVATAIIKLDDCLINPMEFGGYSHSFWLAPPPGVINETNDGKELKWIILASNEEIKFEWIAALIKGAGWRERHIAETGQVPKITVHHPIEESISVGLDSPSTDSVAESPVLSPLQLSSASSSCGNMDTLFPFPTPDLTTLKDTAFSSHATFPESPSQNSRRSSLHSQEALALISASNARFFKNGGYKSTSSSVSRRSSGSASISSKSMDGARSFTEADIRISKTSSGSSSNSSGSAGLASRRASGSATNVQGSQPSMNGSHSSSPSVPVSDKLPRRQTSPNLPRASVRDRMVLERTTSTVSNPGDTTLQRRKTSHVTIRETDDAEERSNIG
ncbi:hypothetical protein HDU77_010615 [Chytriomyces hyalinus]|nr:hypothetical protein HDU77_010615 [Chytriomyces hyalinus]